MKWILLWLVLSISSLGQNVQKSTQDYDFRGLKLGAATLDEVRAKVPGLDCSMDKRPQDAAVGRIECSRTVADKEDLFFTFVDKVLCRASMWFESREYPRMIDALTDKFGQPQSKISKQDTLLGGREIENEIVTWNNGTSSIELMHFYAFFNQSAVT